MADLKAVTPIPLPETQRYWAAARRHALELPYCTACRAFHYYPRATCPHCLSGDLEWRPVSGRGRLHTFTIVHRGPKDFPLGTPYVPGLSSALARWTGGRVPYLRGAVAARFGRDVVVVGHRAATA